MALGQPALLPTPDSLSATWSTFDGGGRPAPASTPPRARRRPALRAAADRRRHGLRASCVDLFACTLRRVPLAGLPLLAIYSLPVSLLGGGHWLAFVLRALLLRAPARRSQESDRLGRWGRSLSVGPQPADALGLGTVRPAGTPCAIGASAHRAGRPPAGADPARSTSASSAAAARRRRRRRPEVSIANPMVDLRRDLARGEDLRCCRSPPTTPTRRTCGSPCSTRSPATPGRPAAATSRPSRRADGRCRRPAGHRPTTCRGPTYESRSMTDELRVDVAADAVPVDHRSSAGDDWRYDSGPSTSSRARRRRRHRRPESYSVSSLVTPSSARRRWPTPARRRSRSAPTYTELPDDLPETVGDLAARGHRRGAEPTSSGRCAAAVVPRGRRLRATPSNAPPGNGTETLDAFLDDGHRARAATASSSRPRWR